MIERDYITAPSFEQHRLDTEACDMARLVLQRLGANVTAALACSVWIEHDMQPTLATIQQVQEWSS